MERSSWDCEGFKIWCGQRHIFVSLRGTRFRLVSEQRKTKERDSRFWPREKWNKSQKMKVGGGTLSLTPFFARSLTLVPRSLLLNRTETLATQASYLSVSTTYTTLDWLHAVIPRQPIVFRSTFGDEIGKFNISFRAIGMPNFHRIEVMFNSKPSLKKNTLYHIMVLISGAKSGKGCKGLKTVKIGGVTFTFSRPC